MGILNSITVVKKCNCYTKYLAGNETRLKSYNPNATACTLYDNRVIYKLKKNYYETTR